MSKLSNDASFDLRKIAAWSNATLITVVILIRFMFDLMRRSDNKSSRLIRTAANPNSMVDDETSSATGGVEIACDSAVLMYVNGDLKTPYDIVIERSTSALLRLLRVSDNDLTEKSKYAERPWLLSTSELAKPQWTSSCDTDGIILRTIAKSRNSAQHALSILLSKSITSGLEGISELGSTEVVGSYLEGSVIVKRICFKGSLRAARREFIIVTSICHLPDGSYIMSSRSLYAPESSPRYMRRSRSGHVKGIIYAAGFHIRPIISSSGDSCEVRYGCHLNMLGPVASEGAANKRKLEDLSSSLRLLMDEISTCPAIDGEYLRNNRTAVRTISLKSDHVESQMDEEEGEEIVPRLLGMDLHAKHSPLELSPDQISSILSESSSACRRIKECHRSLMASIGLSKEQSTCVGSTSVEEREKEREKEKERETPSEPEATCWTAGVWNTAPVPYPIPVSHRCRSISDADPSPRCCGDCRECNTKTKAKEMIDAWDMLTSENGVTTYEAVSTSSSASSTVYAAQCNVQVHY
jgi:hypothetical protein